MACKKFSVAGDSVAEPPVFGGSGLLNFGGSGSGGNKVIKTNFLGAFFFI